MEENKVTISLEKYQEMEREIIRLKCENLEKTIYKTHPVDYVIFAILLFGILFIHQYLKV